MNCPDCGHETYRNGNSLGCYAVDVYTTHEVECNCSLTKEQAEILARRKSAQRAAAIAHLRRYGLLACKWRKAQCNKELTVLQRDFLYKCEMDTMNKIFFAIAAYRAVGILRERKP